MTYPEFKEKYGIQLNSQQEQALLAVEGTNQLIAVPGSGKTTVLVARLGYMTLVKGIDPEKILAITFTRKAAEEMKQRFCQKFGSAIGEKISFRTINSLSREIYVRWRGWNSEDVFDSELPKRLSIQFYQQLNDEYPTEVEIQELTGAIGYAKNMMLSVNEIRKIDDQIPNFSTIYYYYKKELKRLGKMDIDDQMVSALGVLRKHPEQLDYWRNRYQYISVDEAQDTSKIQHEIIHLLSGGKNIFMVGDEDQSIYGFRGAYPTAFLDFCKDYENAHVLRMETNYRSTEQIVAMAQSFISKNSGRYEKHMTSAREKGEDVHLIRVNTVEDQYHKILNIAKNVTTETAVLYRDNESAVVLVDLFLRHGIRFSLKRPEQNVFSSRVVRDLKDYLTIASDPNSRKSAEAFGRICNHGIIYMKKEQKQYVLNYCRRGMPLFEAVEAEMKYVRGSQRDRASSFKSLMEKVSHETSFEAINTLMSNGYNKYLSEIGAGRSRVEVLKMLAKQEPDIRSFLSRLDLLESEMTQEFPGTKGAPITLSTIHSSKGLEHDSVYIIDVYDGRFPSTQTSWNSSSNAMEERRLFYVAMTRAKNRLTLFTIKNSPSQYIEELFPEILAERKRTQSSQTQPPKHQYPSPKPQKSKSKKIPINPTAPIAPKKASPSSYEQMIRAKIQEENRRKIEERLKYNIEKNSKK